MQKYINGYTDLIFQVNGINKRESQDFEPTDQQKQFDLSFILGRFNFRVLKDRQVHLNRKEKFYPEILFRPCRNMLDKLEII